MENSEQQNPRLSRRTVLKWFASAAAVMQVGALESLNYVASAAEAGRPAAKGYGQDPDVSQYYNPGDFWPLTFTKDEKETTAALADVILPADQYGPAASTVRVPDFMDEWVSAPYPVQVADRAIIIPGLKWLAEESQKRFKKSFASLNDTQKRAICDDICWPADAKAEFKKAAAFFVKFRDVAAGAYYGTPEGWKAVGYVGNEALMSFDGPPKEVLDRLGVTQTVK
ncbi:MAG TPA: gluconate 2-dehydrogenase subunit 3 family protein [Verrucomicrobiae bacterium]